MSHGPHEKRWEILGEMSSERIEFVRASDYVKSAHAEGVAKNRSMRAEIKLNVGHTVLKTRLS